VLKRWCRTLNVPVKPDDEELDFEKLMQLLVTYVQLNHNTQNHTTNAQEFQFPHTLNMEDWTKDTGQRKTLLQDTSLMTHDMTHDIISRDTNSQIWTETDDGWDVLNAQRRFLETFWIL
jgi:hypothetical protein